MRHAEAFSPCLGLCEPGIGLSDVPRYRLGPGPHTISKGARTPGRPAKQTQIIPATTEQERLCLKYSKQLRPIMHGALTLHEFRGSEGTLRP